MDTLRSVHVSRPSSALVLAILALAHPKDGERRLPVKEDEMADKVVVNLTTGLEDAERVTVAFLVGGAAVEQGKQVAMFLTKEAVRLGLPGYAEGIACDGCPPLARLFEQYAEGGGELLVCPICFNARQLDEAGLVENARLAGATPLWEWIGDDEAAIFSY
jgi:predicted peroxiredoxin